MSYVRDECKIVSWEQILAWNATKVRPLVTFK